MNSRDSAAFAIAITVMITACSLSSKPELAAPDRPWIKGFPKAEVLVAREDRQITRFAVEVAETPEQRASGLMHVRSLPAGSGMAFTFPSETNVPFHMKDTLLALDIAFWNAEGTIVEILQMEPCTEDPCKTYQSSAPFVAALEVEKGNLLDAGIEVGDVVTLRRLDRRGQ